MTAPGSTRDTRSLMTSFWADHSKDASLEEMFLDYDASKLCAEEQPEILSLLPSLAGKRVLELGAGIGRFTGLLAKSSRHVTAVDFMETFVSKNRDNNSHHGNIEFIQADVTKLDLPPDSYDVIFSNWLLQYLTDEEVWKLTRKTLSWLSKDGLVFCRETCFYPVNQVPVGSLDFNPTFYRDSAYYDNVFRSVDRSNPDNGTDGQATRTGFDILKSRSVESYIKVRNQQNQFCWLVQKVQRKSDVN